MINWCDLLTNMAHNATLIAYICHLSVIDGFTDTKNTCHRPLCVILVLQKNVSFWEELFSVFKAYESTFTGAINLWSPVIQHIFQQSACTTLSWYSTCPETMMTSSTLIQLQQTCNVASTKTICDILWRTSSCDIGILILRKVMEQLINLWNEDTILILILRKFMEICFLHVLFFPIWFAMVRHDLGQLFHDLHNLDLRHLAGWISDFRLEHLNMTIWSTWNILKYESRMWLYMSDLYMWMSYMYSYVYCIE